MSTNLKELAGREGRGLLVTQFSGGEKDGLCLQFSCSLGSYASLKMVDVLRLQATINEWVARHNVPRESPTRTPVLRSCHKCRKEFDEEAQGGLMDGSWYCSPECFR